MKKKVWIVAPILLVLVVFASVLILHFTSKNDVSSTKTELIEQKIISISNYDEFDKLVNEEEWNVFYSDDKTIANIMEFDFWGSTAEMTMVFDNKKNIESFNIYFPLCTISELSSENSDSKIEDQVYDVCRETIRHFSELFNVQYTQNIQLTNYDGTFHEVESTDDINSLINEESYINFAVHDKNGYYYVMQISFFESILEVEIMKFFDVDKYKDYVANISLYEGA